MTTPGPLSLLRAPAWRARAAAWALAALFGVAFAPWVSRAVHAVRGMPPDAFAHGCSVEAHRAAGTGAGAAAARHHDDGDAACALCVLAHAAPLTGAPAVPALTVVAFRPVRVDGPLASGRPAEAPRHARARAPPSTVRVLAAAPRDYLA